MSIYGGRHRTRAQQVMSDGRVKTSGGRLEVWLDEVLNAIGYEPHKKVKVHVPQEWTRYDHSLDLEPDSVVEHWPEAADPYTMPQTILVAVLADGHHWHDRTLRQDHTDAKKDEWYVRQGYRVIHVGEYWLKTKGKRLELEPLLLAALHYEDAVVDLAT